MSELTMVASINKALADEMARDDRIIVLGEDVGVNGGIFRVTQGLIDRFGPDRVLDTPLAEAAIIGGSVGMAAAGLKPVPELQFSGFSYFAFHHVEGHIARFRKRTRGRFPMPLVVRMPYGAGVHALEHHSESRETYYAHTPGLKVVLPSGPRSAHDLLLASLRDPDPVIFMEPKALYRRVREEVPDEAGELPELGKAERVREGSDLTLVSWGHMLQRTLEAAERLEAEDAVSVDVLDLHTIKPMDTESIVRSVRETGRCVVVHEAPRTLGPGAEIVARLNEQALLYLEAPVVRVTGWDVHVPLFAREDAYMPTTDRILQAARSVLAWR